MSPVTVVTRGDELERLIPEWTELAGDTDEPNAFYEPFVMLPALEQIGGGSDVRVLFLRAADGRLIGVVPLERHRWSLAIPAPHFSLWKHRYCFLATPILRRGHAEAAVAALSAWLDTAGIAGRFLRLPAHVANGAFDRAIERSARESGQLVRETGRYERPSLVTGAPPERYFEGIPPKRLSDLRRRLKRLGQVGEVAFHEARTVAELETWLPRFLELEDRGWKGQAGSSMAANPKDRAFIEGVARRSGARHRLGILALTVNGAPVAMATSLRTGGEAFSFKIAYDEEFGKFSPGMLLQYEYLERFLVDGVTVAADSCRGPDYAGLDTLWGQRRTIRQADLVRADRLGRGVIKLGEPLEDLGAAASAWMRGLPPAVQRPLRQLNLVLRG